MKSNCDKCEALEQQLRDQNAELIRLTREMEDLRRLFKAERETGGTLERIEGEVKRLMGRP